MFNIFRYKIFIECLKSRLKIYSKVTSRLRKQGLDSPPSKFGEALRNLLGMDYKREKPDLFLIRLLCILFRTESEIWASVMCQNIPHCQLLGRRLTLICDQNCYSNCTGNTLISSFVQHLQLDMLLNRKFSAHF